MKFYFTLNSDNIFKMGIIDLGVMVVMAMIWIMTIQSSSYAVAYVLPSKPAPIQSKLFATQSSSPRKHHFPANSCTNAAILGGGTFSLAMAHILSTKNVQCRLLVRHHHVADHVNMYRRHPKYLSDLALSDSVTATADPVIALQQANLIIHAIPVQESRSFLASIQSLIAPNIPILSVSKGIEQHTYKLMNAVIADALGKHNTHPVSTAFLSGPSFAREIILGKPTAVVIGSRNVELAQSLAGLLSTDSFHCQISEDVEGVEIGGAMKNVIAIAAGLCEGLGYGMNSLAALLTRACKEMTNVGVILGAKAETFTGLAGIGDTFATCFSPLSRNRRVGIQLAKGETLHDLTASKDGVSEGIFTVLALEGLMNERFGNEYFVHHFPIFANVARIVRGTILPQEGMQAMMRYSTAVEQNIH